jgi:hypothetical protein
MSPEATLAEITGPKEEALADIAVEVRAGLQQWREGRDAVVSGMLRVVAALSPATIAGADNTLAHKKIKGRSSSVPSWAERP